MEPQTGPRDAPPAPGESAITEPVLALRASTSRNPAGPILASPRVPSVSEIIRAIEKVGESFEQYKRSSDAKFAELAKRLDEVDERREQEEAEADRPEAHGSPSKFSAEHREHKSRFLDWIRQPSDAHVMARLAEAQNELAQKDVSIGTPSAGGYAVPKEIEAQIEARARTLNPWRSLVDVASAGSSDIHALVDMSDNTSGWSSETGSRSATGTPTLRDRQPTGGELYALLSATNWSLEDMFFNVEQWLVDDSSKDFAVQEATAIVSGNGSNRPTGFTNAVSTSSDSASPMRAAGTVQYVTSSHSPNTVIDIDSLITLKSTLADEYRVEADRCAFVMRTATWDQLAKSKASTAGTYHRDPFAPPPESILGYRLVVTDSMPAQGSATYPVAFGNWRRGYFLRDRGPLRITVDQVSTPGFTRFYIRRRVYGAVKNNDAIKLLRTG
jgi:HK97 family phage major capsid protein